MLDPAKKPELYGKGVIENKKNLMDVKPVIEVDTLAAGVDTLVGHAEVSLQRLRQVIRVVGNPLQPDTTWIVKVRRWNS
jgi:hypothetical protein